ncbi:unnamed protein product [Moneuplotes crassus]|uniref:Transmembrane protein n=1 Tax=Euplotes crassus TaxID=5936 RepID=A0AAD1Y8V1_EUPCR|nr:unnamed protein product [Moneuplotes crassus]
MNSKHSNSKQDEKDTGKSRENYIPNFSPIFKAWGYLSSDKINNSYFQNYSNDNWEGCVYSNNNQSSKPEYSSSRIIDKLLDFLNLSDFYSSFTTQTTDQKLSKIIQSKHKKHLDFTWKILYILQHLIALMICLQIFTEDLSKPGFLAQLINSTLFMVLVNIIKLVKKRRPNIVHYFLPCLLFLVGSSIAIENCLFEEFRFYELWIIWYMEALAFSATFFAYSEITKPLGNKSIN